MRSTATIAGLSGLLLLGACKGGHSAAAAGQTADANASAAAAPATLATPKPGLWEISATGDGMLGAVKTRACVGTPPPGVNPFAPPKLAVAGGNCTKNAFTRTASGYAIDIECKVNGMTMTSTGEVSGDFASDYKTVMHTRMGGPGIPAAMQTDRASTSEAKYVGACPSGMRPGTVQQSS